MKCPLVGYGGVFLLYQLVRFFCKLFLYLFFRVKITGQENIPKQGAVILASNHIHIFDPICLAVSSRRNISFMAKKELFKNKLFSKLLKKLGTFPVNRGGKDGSAIKQSLKILHHSGVLGIFPEGTRSKTGKLQEGHPGVGLFGLKTDAVVIPVAIVSSYKWFSAVHIIIGKPVDLSFLKQEESSPELSIQATKIIMSDIQTLLTSEHSSD